MAKNERLKALEKKSPKNKDAGKDRKSCRRPTLEFEKSVGFPRLAVAGVDEVGRGCLAGPVVAGAVILPDEVDYQAHPWLLEIFDSKLVKPETRERLVPLIEGWAKAWAIGVATVEDIDRINIFHASHLAMQRAVAGLQSVPAHILVDGKFKPKELPCESTAIVQGDLKCLSIAAASILAKVWRDRQMVELDSEYPGYGFAVHKGYSTPEHSAALDKNGVLPIHRRSFAPVAERLGRGTLPLFAEAPEEPVSD